MIAQSRLRRRPTEARQSDAHCRPSSWTGVLRIAVPSLTPGDDPFVSAPPDELISTESGERSQQCESDASMVTAGQSMSLTVGGRYFSRWLTTYLQVGVSHRRKECHRDSSALPRPS